MRPLIVALALVAHACACSRVAPPPPPKWVEYTIADSPQGDLVETGTPFPYFGSGHPPSELVRVETPLHRFRVASVNRSFDAPGRPTISFTIDERDVAQFSDFTAEHVGSELVFLVDGRVVGQGNISERLPGTCQLHAGFTEAELEHLIHAMK